VPGWMEIRSTKGTDCGPRMNWIVGPALATNRRPENSLRRPSGELLYRSYRLKSAYMCMFVCNGWGAIDGACVHAWARQGAFACMQVGMHAAASAARTVHAGAFCFIFHDSSCPTLLALHFLSLAL
jgi:hypothetical protein